MRTTLLGSLVLVAGLWACGDDDSEPSVDCSTLTYENSGKPLADAYCIQCHSSQLTGEARKGGVTNGLAAPLGVDFDTEAGLLESGQHGVERIRDENLPMPPEGFDAPSEAEVTKLEQWLDCEGAEHDHDHAHEEG